MGVLFLCCKPYIFEFLEYWNKSGNTIIHITHEEDAINQAENVLLLEKGQVLYYGKKTAFLQKEEFTKNICKSFSFSDRFFNFVMTKT